MKIAIRVDASSQIGSGHFMRCLTLANALQQRGKRICFVSRHLPDYLQALLTAKGHEFALIAGDIVPQTIDELAHSSWLGVSQTQDAEESLCALSDKGFDWLIVDHYALDARWETKLRSVSKKIMVIDDVADRQHDCDVLLDQNYYPDMHSRYLDKVPDHCQLLLGPRYALLREEFRKLRQELSPRTGSVKKILVFFGGMDVNNFTGQAINALAGWVNSDIGVDIVIGAQHPARASIESDCRSFSFTCHVQTSQMAELMAAADLSIGAGGAAMWERCCLGLPTITFCTADNQRDQIAGAASEGWVYAPDEHQDVENLIKRHLSVLIESRFTRQLISRNACHAVDGRGVERVIASMGCHVLEIRAATLDDAEDLFSWRNHPSIRSVSRNNDAIRWEDHKRWLTKVLNDPNRLLLIGLHKELPVGVVRFDIQHDRAEVSIYLVPEFDNKGRGGDLLQSAERWFTQYYPEIKRLDAEVLGANVPSHRLFLSAGYQVEATAYFKILSTK